jgi:hypothetical protein
MSWLTRIQDIELEITTGDGNTFSPLWKEAKKNVKYNTEAFDFIDIEGTYVGRKKSKGGQFPILLYFQGEDCIEQLQAFELSSRDPRPWTIKHPFYDDILAQPLSLEFDNTSMNVSIVRGTIWETIENQFPIETSSTEKEVNVRKQQSDDDNAASFVNAISTPDAATVQSSGFSITNTAGNYETFTSQSDDISTLKDLARKASAAAQEIVLFPDRYIEEAINLINFPFLIAQDIGQKVAGLLASINQFADIFLPDGLEDDKILYEYQSTIMFTELSRNIISSKEEDYVTRGNTLSIIDNITDTYNLFLTNLDDNEIVQNSTSAIELDYIVNLALSKLFDIAFTAKQERTYILDKDNNVVNLAHRFLGPGDDNIDLFVSQNKIHLHEYLGLKKGRKIIYYV